MTLSPDHRLLALDSFTTEPVYAYDGDYAYVRNIREVHSLRLISEQADSETFTPFDEQEGPFSPAFSPDGSRLATGNGLQVTLWSTSNVVDSLRLVPDRPLLHSGPVSTLGFSPDGNLLAVGGTNDNAGFVQLWRMEAYPPQAFGESIAFDQPVTQVAFGTDTVYIASGGRVVGLNLDPDWWLTRACEMLNRNLTQTEWDAVLPGRDYACTCNKRPPGDGTGLTDCSGS